MGYDQFISALDSLIGSFLAQSEQTEQFSAGFHKKFYMNENALLCTLLWI